MIKKKKGSHYWDPFFVINIRMRFILYEFISLTFKRWLFLTDRVYLRLELFSDGSWSLEPSGNYQVGEISKRDWRRIRRQCKKQIRSCQKNIISQHFASSRMVSSTSNYKTNKRLSVPFDKCLEKVEKDYNLMFKGKV